MKVAIVHDWLTDPGGAEKVLQQFLISYPDADLFTVVDFFPEKARKELIFDKRANTTFIQNLPFAKSKYRNYLPLMPLAIEQLDLSSYDLVLSSSYAVAKGVITGPDQVHVSYVHSPIRYAWDLQHQYLRESGLSKGFKGWLAKWFLHKIRLWDYRTAHGVDHYISNSNFISKRIKKVYGKDATVIYPPVDTSGFTFWPDKEDFYLTASRMVPYKRIDLIVEAFAQMPDKKLVVIGDGPDMEKIKAKATSNIQIMGYQPYEVLKEHMQKAKAFVFAAEEDFGITPVEAQACGTAVIAFGKGGALETVIASGDNQTGVFFESQTVDSLKEAVEKFHLQANNIKPEACRKNAERFSPERFRHEIESFVSKSLS
ncbi:MAG: glycosyltransferase family 4 protein [Methylophilus methylotrophus]|uniref:Glycosyltransferase family 4 protein n=1 Tax=Methylophilus methylotrophus TaxID=17 RepID=A0A5C7WKR7_METME|nr:MAG: glycosyltransferase family 4 protein [Methylophilus methylotrophus]